MDSATREQYLSSQIFTATPERLHLMLIDGAIRFAGQLRGALAAGDWDAATNVGERCRNVLSEMLLCVNRDGNDAAKRLRSIYTFLIRDVADAQLRRQADKLDGVLGVLSIERDTWAQVCEQTGERDFRRDAPHDEQRAAANMAAPMPSLEPPALPSESFSFRA
jgi:flagellar protein FliS